MRKVVSIALFGKDTRYAQYLGAFVRAHLTLFPQNEDWELRVHVDEYNAGGFLGALEKKGLIRLVRCESAPLTKAMLWRMKPVFDETVDYVFCRDIDALPTPRDRACCERFMESGLDVHAIHDSTSHDGLMGGMGGYNCESFREQIQQAGIHSWDDLVVFGKKTDEEYAKHGTDQDVLNALCLGWGRDRPGARLAVFEHRYAGWSGGKSGKSDRKASAWATVSEPTPDEGHMTVLTNSTIGSGVDWTIGLDAMCSHLGAAGFDVDKAVRFYDEWGPSAVMTAIRDCES